MKIKVTLMLSFLALAFTAAAQDTTTEFKPEAGAKTLETNLNFNYGISAAGIQYRSFSTPTNAFRLGASAHYNYNKISNDAYTRTYSVSVAPGIEKHFAGTNRLSPYIGIAAPIGFNSIKYENETMIIDGGTYYYDNYPNRRVDSPSNFSIGLNALAGVDFYISKNFYTGIEFTSGISYFKNLDSEVKFKENTSPTITVENFHRIGFSAFQASGLRLGFVF